MLKHPILRADSCSETVLAETGVNEFSVIGIRFVTLFRRIAIVPNRRQRRDSRQPPPIHRNLPAATADAMRWIRKSFFSFSQFYYFYYFKRAQKIVDEDSEE